MTCVCLAVAAAEGVCADPAKAARQAGAPTPAASATTPDTPPVSVRPTLPPELQPYGAIGSQLARNSRLREAGLSEAQRAAFVAGVRAALDGDPYPYDEAAALLYTDLDRRITAIEAELRAQRYAEPGAMEAFMKATCEGYKLERADSGLGFGIIEGNGNLRPSPEDIVVFSMKAMTDDGESEIPRLTKQRMRARVSDLMPGLAEGLQLMTLDARAMLVIPPELSFGSGTWPDGVIRGTPMFVIVTLHEIISPPVDP